MVLATIELNMMLAFLDFYSFYVCNSRSLKKEVKQSARSFLYSGMFHSPSIQLLVS